MAYFSWGCPNADTKDIIVKTCTICTLEKFSGKYNYLPFENVQNINKVHEIF